jgi:hypothetical protein
MIALLGATAITLTVLQATINAPTEAFRACLKEASTKAKAEKVAPDAIEQYLRNACTVQMGSLKSAVIAFRTKNGMARKAATEDADLTVEDYLAAPVDKYKFMATLDAPAPAQPAATAQPAKVQASAPVEPKQ